MKTDPEESNSIQIRKNAQTMKIAKSRIDPASEPRINRDVRTIVRRRLHSALGFVILACFLTAVNSSRAGQPLFMSRVGQPVFITRPPAISPVVTSTQAQGASANPNQAAMSQIINQLNQSQFQLSAAAAQTSAQRSRSSSNRHNEACEIGCWHKSEPLGKRTIQHNRMKFLANTGRVLLVAAVSLPIAFQLQAQQTSPLEALARRKPETKAS